METSNTDTNVSSNNEYSASSSAMLNLIPRAADVSFNVKTISTPISQRILF